MEKLLITTGKQYADIDGFACAVAYAEAFRLMGLDAEALIPAPLNYSVPHFLLDPLPKYRYDVINNDYSIANKFIKYTIVDTQDLGSLPDFVDIEKILELYDHRWGTEEYWKTKLHDNCHIEMVGACATLIWEQIKRFGVESKISESPKKLMACAIASNTLNFRSKNTTERDKQAYAEICAISNIDANLAINYFTQVQLDIEKNIETSVILDTKTLKMRDGTKVTIGQLEIWDGEDFIRNNQFKITQIFNKLGSKWLLTSPSIKNGYNIFFTRDDEIKHILDDLLQVQFNGDIAKTDSLWLRKEIIKKLSDNNIFLF